MRFKLFGSLMVPVPGALWKTALDREARRTRRTFDRLSPDHKRVRRHAAMNVAVADGPLSPESIAAETDLSVERTRTILADLERKMLFLVRNADGNVSWAYPNTTDETPHHLTFESGERMTAA